MRFGALVLAGLLVGCARERRAPSSASPPSASASASASSLADGTAGAPPPAPATVSTPPPALGSAPNLLDVVPARLAVSSTVANPRDFPEHLVDGRADTAWQSRTGDLVGGAIRFRLPVDVHVARLEMNAGYDRVRGAVDLFTANHRITRVRVSRDGTSIGDFALDPQVRGLQVIPVDGPGGDYELTVLATLPGANPKWRELVVSELRVVGTPGKERREPDDPLRVVVGTLDQDPTATMPDATEDVARAFPTVEALCADYVQSVDARHHELEETAKSAHLPLRRPSCHLATRSLGVTFTPTAMYKRAFFVERSDGIGTQLRVVTELPRGLVMTAIGWDTLDPLDPGCPSIPRTQGLETLRVENGFLVAILRQLVARYDENAAMKNVSIHDATWCGDQDGTLRCRTYESQYQPPLNQFAIAPSGALVRQGEAVEDE